MPLFEMPPCIRSGSVLIRVEINKHNALTIASMKTTLSRRRFIAASIPAGLGLAALPAGLVHGMEQPIKRPGKPRFALSLAAYSFRDYFNPKDATKRITLFDFIDYCADQGCDATELTSYYFPKELDREFLLQVRRHAFLRGMPISGTAVGNTFSIPKGPKRDEQIAHVKTWVDHAAVMGAPHIRVFAGAAEGVGKAEAKILCISALEECSAYAGSKGIFLGLENHGGIVALPGDLLDIVKAVQSPWLGINLDTGNFNTEDPYADLALCVPYAVNVQFKVEIARKGQKKEPADFEKLVRILRESNYQGYVALEYEAAEDPFKAVPGHLRRMAELLRG
jgi:sugar phosphate isomerase/epimerase